MKEIPELENIYRLFKEKQGKKIEGSLEEVEVRLSRPGLFPEKDILLAFRNGNTVAFACFKMKFSGEPGDFVSTLPRKSATTLDLQKAGLKIYLS